LQLNRLFYGCSYRFHLSGNKPPGIPLLVELARGELAVWWPVEAGIEGTGLCVAVAPEAAVWTQQRRKYANQYEVPSSVP